MSILESGNKLSPAVQVLLADYGIMRTAAKKEAPKHSGKGPAFFGMYEDAEKYRLYFTDDLDSLDNDMDLAIVAPDNEPFDMLASKDYSTKLRLKEPEELRAYLRKLVDAV